jgi:pyridinium-3,5-biscarboxylic acid mononucleotide sulfurtransferase
MDQENRRMDPRLNLTGLEPGLQARWQALLQRLDGLGEAVVAYSGGVDSSLLAVVAHLALAPRMLAVTIRSAVETTGIMETASQVAAQFGFPHQFIDYDKLQDPEYVENSPQRCYVCKSVDLGLITALARQAGLRWVLLGANADDLSDYRPGLRAARELEVISPLAEAGLSKADVRDLSRRLGLGNWNHPSSPCLASRIPYGIPVSREKLEGIAAGEAYLRALSFSVVRVRSDGSTARIEVLPEEIARLAGLHQVVAGYFRQLGFQYVTLDLGGYRQGSLNEVLPGEQAGAAGGPGAS